MHDRILDSLLDLFLGSCCTVCGRPGRLLCSPCASALPHEARVSWPTPCPEGLVTPTSAGEYDGALKLLVNAHKERHQLALARPLGALLATAVLEHVKRRPGTPGPGPVVPGRWLLVPVPSSARVVRARGHDPMYRVALRAASLLRGQGVEARVERLLLSMRAVHDQAGLDAVERHRNVTTSMACHERRAAWLGAGQRHTGRDRVLVVDDVVTTGATLREGQRALEAAGVRVTGAATVAATRRTGRGQYVGSLPFCCAGD